MPRALRQQMLFSGPFLFCTRREVMNMANIVIVPLPVVTAAQDVAAMERRRRRRRR